MISPKATALETTAEMKNGDQGHHLCARTTHPSKSIRWSSVIVDLLKATTYVVKDLGCSAHAEKVFDLIVPGRTVLNSHGE